MTLAVDASVAVEYLLGTELGRRVAPQLESDRLVAPELIDAEVLAALRRARQRHLVTERRAAEAVSDLRAWPLIRLSHRPLLADAWRLRGNVSAYDALYLAAALAHSTPLITADGRLARAPRVGVLVQHVAM